MRQWVALALALGTTGCAKSSSDVLLPPVTANASVSGIVWRDVDADGIRDATEPGFSGVGMSLIDSSGVSSSTQTTDNSGSFRFDGLEAGSYLLAADTSGLAVTIRPSACGVANDCSAIPVDLTDGQQQFVFDVGLRVCEAEMGDYVWLDLDCDGVQGPAEPGIPGVQVDLLDSAGSLVASTVTDSAGHYLFRELCGATYTVLVAPETLPAEAFAAPCESGPDDQLDSDCSPLLRILGDDTTVDLSLDFGYCTPCYGAIGDFVWFDVDCDGRQGPDEPGIAEIPVFLRDLDGEVLAQTRTGQDGHYEFSGLCAGSYLVEIDHFPSSLVITTCRLGADPAVDSNCLPTLISLLSNESVDDTVDFGLCARTAALEAPTDNPSRTTEAGTPSVRVSGTVFDAAQTGLDRSRLQVVVRNDEQRISALAKVDQAGRFTLSDLPSGRLHFRLEVAPGTPTRQRYAPFLAASHKVLDMDRESAFELDWQLAR